MASGICCGVCLLGHSQTFVDEVSDLVHSDIDATLCCRWQSCERRSSWTSCDAEPILSQFKDLLTVLVPGSPVADCASLRAGWAAASRWWGSW